MLERSYLRSPDPEFGKAVESGLLLDYAIKGLLPQGLARVFCAITSTSARNPLTAEKICYWVLSNPYGLFELSGHDMVLFNNIPLADISLLVAALRERGWRCTPADLRHGLIQSQDFIYGGVR